MKGRRRAEEANREGGEVDMNREGGERGKQ